MNIQQSPNNHSPSANDNQHMSSTLSTACPDSNSLIVVAAPQAHDPECEDYRMVRQRCASLPCANKERITRVNAKSLLLGRLLGQGSFNSVYSVSSQNGHELRNNNWKGNWNRASSFEDDHSSSSTTRNNHHHNFALKRLRPEQTNGAARDLLYEFEILSRLPPHEHIIQLAAISNDLLQRPAQGFLVLEQVHETLQRRLAKWARRQQQQQQQATPSPLQRLKQLFGPQPNPATTEQEQQQTVMLAADQRDRLSSCGAAGMAAALQWLHQHGIVFRDVKPDNIGYAADGTVKLLDFGLARPTQQYQGNARRLSGQAGSARYMAPEVARSLDYGTQADVYSFSMVLHEICTLAKPYSDIVQSKKRSSGKNNNNNDGIAQWYKKVITQHKRPSLKAIAAPELQTLLTAAWAPNPHERPTMALVGSELTRILTTTATSTISNSTRTTGAARLSNTTTTAGKSTSILTTTTSTSVDETGSSSM